MNCFRIASILHNNGLHICLSGLLPLHQKVRGFRSSQSLNGTWIDREYVSWRASSGPDPIEVQKTFVEVSADGVQVSNRRDSTDSESGLRSNQVRVSLAQSLSSHRACLDRVNLVSAGGKEQNGFTAFLTSENDGFHDLVNMAVCGLRSLSSRAGFAWHLANVGFQSRRFQRSAHPFQASAHFESPQNGEWLQRCPQKDKYLPPDRVSAASTGTASCAGSRSNSEWPCSPGQDVQTAVPGLRAEDGGDAAKIPPS